jgi:DNA modification methylase
VTIYAKGERWTLYLGDARDVLPGFATESVDLVVVDPPYGVEWRSNVRAERFEGMALDGAGEREGVREILRESVRLVGQHRHLYVFGPDDVLEGLKVTKPVRLVWDKGTPGSGNLEASWGPQHEEISFLVSKHRHAGEAGRDSIAARRRKGSVLRFSRPTGRKVRHPSEKPVPLLRELIESSSRVGETVLDPCAGIGSTGVAAVLLGRKAVLVELKESYAAAAFERLRKAEALALEAERL